MPTIRRFGRKIKRSNVVDDKALMPDSSVGKKFMEQKMKNIGKKGMPMSQPEKMKQTFKKMKKMGTYSDGVGVGP